MFTMNSEPTFLLDLGCFSMYRVPGILSKVSLKLENCLHSLPLESMNFKDLIEHLCKLGTLCIESEAVGFRSSVICLLSLLCKLRHRFSSSESSVIEEFLEKSFHQVKEGLVKIPSDVLGMIFEMRPALFEREVITLMEAVCVSPVLSADLHLKDNILVSACSLSPPLFQKFLSIITHAWFVSDGSSGVEQLLKEFVAAVKQICFFDSFLNLFPENMRSLVISYSFPPNECLKVDVWSPSLVALKLKVCSREEIIMLMGIFSEWYNQLLMDVRCKSSSKAVQLMKILWSCDDEMRIQEEIQRSEGSAINKATRSEVV